MTLAARAHDHAFDAWDEASPQLVLLRHAQAELHGRFCGHSNPGLSIEGQREIPHIIGRLSSMPPSVVWSSDLRRAEQTAAPIAKHFGIALQTSSSLREMNFGLWEGLTWEEVEVQFPQDARAWSKSFPRGRPHGGESFDEFQKRVVTELERLLKEPEHRVLIVTHAGFIRTAVAAALGMPDDQILSIGVDYGVATVLQRVRSHWVVGRLDAGKFTSPLIAIANKD